MYATAAIWRVTPWIIGPIMAGLFSRLFGERIVWSLALFGKLAVPLTLATHPHPDVISLMAIWQGFTGALMWIAGLSLVQMVPTDRKGFANGMLMTSMGIGSLMGPICGRVLLYRGEVGELISGGQSGEALHLLAAAKSRYGCNPHHRIWVLQDIAEGCDSFGAQSPKRIRRCETHRFVGII